MIVGGKMAEELREGETLPFPVELPSDVVAAASFDADAESRVAPYDDVPDGWLGLDIGPETRERFGELIRGAKTVFWNGPMGVFEWERFAEGTKAVAEAVAAVDGYTVVGGRRLGARDLRARARRRRLVGLDRRRRVARAARGQGAARRGRDPARLADLGDGVDAPRAGHALQLVLAAVGELEPGAGDEVANGLGDEDLRRACEGA